VDDSSSVASLYQSDAKIYARSVSGWFNYWRWALVFATQLVFYGLPWLSINDRQAMLFDLASRRFYIFNLVLYPQDLIYLTGFTFVGYFTPIKELASGVAQFALGPWELFWVLFYGFATYGNAGWMREQVCKYMCPYARFQSAMFDRDTLVVAYDVERGEGRGARPRNDTPDQYHAKGLGDCIDCGLCVQVCPTGIDIRNGLQYECISCSGCIDVCNSVMDKMHYPRGLIRYSTESGLAQNLSSVQMLKRVFRPRVLVYIAVLTAVTTGLLWSLLVRSDFKVDVERDRGSIARMVGQGMTENVYRLQIMNATEQVQSYVIQVRGLEGAQILPDVAVVIEPANSRWLPLRVQVPPGLTSGSHPISFVITSQADPANSVVEKSVFLVPR
jgi:cytochrome c oxidase accessory protein FixG